MGVRTVLPLLALCCCVAVVAAQGECCGSACCLGTADYIEGRVQCCRYFGGCCDQPMNDTRDLLFRLAIGLSIGLFGLLVIIAVLIVCCCCCCCC